MSSQTVAIDVKGLSKRYSLGKKKELTLIESLTNYSREKSNSTKSDFWALENLSFEIKQGDVVGIIGKNGAGKSTLLKILSQITKPTEGVVKINGRIASLLEVGTGFHPELTGRENIYLNGTILGMTRKEVMMKFDEIVTFSGVEKFIDTPVKHYSSGMYVRLAFAVAAHLEPEILIIDEVLAVGDAEFQKKCLGKMKDAASQGRTVLFVSHNLTAVASLCNKGIVLDHGRLLFQGEANTAIQEYYKLSKKDQRNDIKGDFDNEYIRVVSFIVKPISGDIITVGSGIEFELVFENKIAGATIDATLELKNFDNVIVFHRGTYIDAENSSKRGTYKVVGQIGKDILNAGSYMVNLIFGQNSTYLLMSCNEILQFDVENSADEQGFKLLPGILKPDLSFSTHYITNAIN